MTETIEVRYKYTGIQSAEGQKMYHKYIVYTDNSGKQYYARGGTTLGNGTGMTPVSLLGKVNTEYGEYKFGTVDYPKTLVPDYSEHIASSNDLSTQWHKILQVMDYVEGQGVAYTPGRNSNSVVDGALAYAGLPLPTGDDRNDPHWAPGETPVPLPPQEPVQPPQPEEPGQPAEPEFSGPVCTPLDPFGWLPKVGDGVDDAAKFTCPLVLDLGAAGIAISNVNTAPVYWDIDNDGFREATAWVGKEDGLLAVDKNNDGQINNHSELFGSAAQDGFAALKAYDSNGDNVINVSDAQFAQLKVWIDANSDGYTQAGELKTLAELGIASINLNAQAVTYDINGNPITAQSTFTMTDNTTRQIVDASLAFRNMQAMMCMPAA